MNFSYIDENSIQPLASITEIQLGYDAHFRHFPAKIDTRGALQNDFPQKCSLLYTCVMDDAGGLFLLMGMVGRVTVWFWNFPGMPPKKYVDFPPTKKREAHIPTHIDFPSKSIWRKHEKFPQKAPQTERGFSMISNRKFLLGWKKAFPPKSSRTFFFGTSRPTTLHMYPVFLEEDIY